MILKSLSKIFLLIINLLPFTQLIKSKPIHDYLGTESFSWGFSLIFVSELLDKTFFINMLYGLKHSFLKTFLISSITLLILNYAELSLGTSLPFFIYREIIDWIAVFIFLFMGIILLHDSYMYTFESPNTLSTPLLNDADERPQLDADTVWTFVTSLIIAECGDKSQITAIVMGAIYNFKGVLIGTSLGLILCILLAITAGRFLSKQISKRQIHFISGIMFTAFGIFYVIDLV